MIRQQIKEYIDGLKLIDHTFITDEEYLRLLGFHKLPELVVLSSKHGTVFHVLAIDYGMCRYYDSNMRHIFEIDLDKLSLEEIIEVGEAYEIHVMT